MVAFSVKHKTSVQTINIITAEFSSQLSAEQIVYGSHGTTGMPNRGEPNNGEGRA